MVSFATATQFWNMKFFSRSKLQHEFEWRDLTFKIHIISISHLALNLNPFFNLFFYKRLALDVISNWSDRTITFSGKYETSTRIQMFEYLPTSTKHRWLRLWEPATHSHVLFVPHWLCFRNSWHWDCCSHFSPIQEAAFKHRWSPLAST